MTTQQEQQRDRREASRVEFEIRKAMDEREAEENEKIARALVEKDLGPVEKSRK